MYKTGCRRRYDCRHGFGKRQGTGTAGVCKHVKLLKLLKLGTSLRFLTCKKNDPRGQANCHCCQIGGGRQQVLAEEEAEAEAAEEEAEVVSSKQSYSNARSAVIVSSDNRRRWLPEVRISRGRLQVCAAFATRATALTRIGRNQHQPSHRRGRAGQG